MNIGFYEAQNDHLSNWWAIIHTAEASWLNNEHYKAFNSNLKQTALSSEY